MRFVVPENDLLRDARQQVQAYALSKGNPFAAAPAPVQEPAPAESPDPGGGAVGQGVGGDSARPLASGASVSGGGDGLLARGGQMAMDAGLGADGARAVQAILTTEGALEGQAGDGGHSFGPLQFYDRGQLANFASQNGMDVSQAGRYVTENPEEALRWALNGYLGDALRAGQARGLSGAGLATFGQTYGQVSEHPERAGAAYNTLFPDSSADPGVQAQAAAARPSQFALGLSPADAMAACGPAAALAFARANGRNPTIDEALQLARQVGCTNQAGMAGVASEQSLLQGLGVPSVLERQVDWSHVASDATSGNPVVVSTPGHYFYVDGYDPGSGQFHVGTSGTDLKNGSDWMSAAGMQAVMGAANGALYADHPAVAASSPTASQTGASPDDGPAASAEQGSGSQAWAGARAYAASLGDPLAAAVSVTSQQAMPGGSNGSGGTGSS